MGLRVSCDSYLQSCGTRPRARVLTCVAQNCYPDESKCLSYLHSTERLQSICPSKPLVRCLKKVTDGSRSSVQQSAQAALLQRAFSGHGLVQDSSEEEYQGWLHGQHALLLWFSLPSKGFVHDQEYVAPSTISSQTVAQGPVPIPDPNPIPTHQSGFQKVAEFCHDFFPLLLVIVVLVEAFLLPLTRLSFLQRGMIVFAACSALLAVAQGLGSMLVYWAAMAIMLFVFYGDVLMELAVVWRREPES